ncbi:hypothetical protein [Bacillus sp. 3255]|uniref:hypothetical protein n=1 Tax=Bacillus sp. 3255 TaxID=2817904 RepID=UPI00286AFD22|nr:hypothetical protein [Bacillus sp. 3255]
MKRTLLQRSFFVACAPAPEGRRRSAKDVPAHNVWLPSGGDSRLGPDVSRGRAAGAVRPIDVPGVRRSQAELTDTGDANCAEIAAMRS